MTTLDPANSQHWQVLVVDDEPDSLEIVTRVLAFHKASVHAVPSGIAALAVLTKIVPTFIIMDLSMPEMDGWELLYHLRNSPKLQKIPVIALTAHAMKGDRERAIGAGFSYYLTKPLNPLSFFDDLLRLFASREMGARPAASPAR